MASSYDRFIQNSFFFVVSSSSIFRSLIYINITRASEQEKRNETNGEKKHDARCATSTKQINSEVNVMYSSVHALSTCQMNNMLWQLQIYPHKMVNKLTKQVIWREWLTECNSWLLCFDAPLIELTIYRSIVVALPRIIQFSKPKCEWTNEWVEKRRDHEIFNSSSGRSRFFSVRLLLLCVSLSFSLFLVRCFRKHSSESSMS